MNKTTQQWLKGWIRFGFLIKGIVYILLGILSIQAALTYRQQAQDIQGILHAIAQQSTGNLLLIMIAIGLAGYSFWRVVEAFLNPDTQTRGLRNWLKRLGSGLSGLAYGILTFTAIQILQGRQQTSETSQVWTAKVLSWPMGQGIVGAIGIGVIGIGMAFFYRTCKADFRKHLQLGTINPKLRGMMIAIGRAGFLARGIIFVLIGGYAIQAAYEFDANKVQTSEETLETIKQQPYGPGLLALVAVGLMAYGVHMGLQARYRQIKLPDLGGGC